MSPTKLTSKSTVKPAKPTVQSPAKPPARSRISAPASQTWPIEQLPGLRKKEQRQLQLVGVNTTLDLLCQTQTHAQLQVLARRLNCPPKYVRKWAALADLSRIPGVGCRYCGLLLHAGISSATQLAEASAHRLHPQLLRLQVIALRRRDLAPTASQVSQWIQAAQGL